MLTRLVSLGSKARARPACSGRRLLTAPGSLGEDAPPTRARTTRGQVLSLARALAFWARKANMVTLAHPKSEVAMPHTSTLAFPEENLVGWERALVAFLVEKERRSGSRPHSRRLLPHAPRLLRQSAKAPDKVTAQEVFIWAHGQGRLRQGPLPRHHRRPHGLPLFVLPLPHSDGHRRHQSL